MKIRYLKHKDIDKQRWDHCMEHAQNGLIYALSWYLDITSPGWDALVYGDYEAVMPLTWRKKYGLKYLIQPYYSQQLGVFGNLSRDGLTQLFLRSIPLKFVLVKINLNNNNILPGVAGRYDFNKNYELRLNSKYIFLFKKYKKRHVRNVKVAQKQNLIIDVVEDLNDFLKFFHTFLVTKFKNNPGRHFKILTNLIKEAQKRNACLIYGVYDLKKELCSVALFLKYNNRWTLLVPASNNSGREHRAMFLLVDYFIKSYSNRNEILDFEGSNIESIANFNEGFGAYNNAYPSVYFINSMNRYFNLSSVRNRHKNK